MSSHREFCGLPAEVISSSKRGGERQKVLKVLYNSTPIIVKCFGIKKGLLRELIRQYGGIQFAVGKSSPSVAGRYRTEQEVMQLWSDLNFDTPRLLDVDFLASAPQPCLAMEWIPGPTLSAIMRSGEYSVEYKTQIIERLAQAMSKRHDRALELHEPRLIVEHPSLTHVLVADDRLAQIDFEISFTRASQIDRFARHEIAGTLLSIAKADRTHSLLFLKGFAGAYDARSRFERTIEELQHYGTVPLAPLLDRAGFLLRASRRYQRTADEARSLALF